MKEAIKKQNLKKEFYTSEKCYITELSNTPDDPDVSIARARVEPGVTTRWHRLKGTYRTLFYYQRQRTCGGWKTTAAGSNRR